MENILLHLSAQLQKKRPKTEFWHLIYILGYSGDRIADK